MIDAVMQEGQMVVKVQDTGSGIPKKFRKVLFEPYRQADSSLTRPHQGTGLGASSSLWVSIERGADKRDMSPKV